MNIGLSKDGAISILGLLFSVSSIVLLILCSDLVIFYQLQNKHHGLLQLTMERDMVNQNAEFIQQEQRKIVIKAALLRLKQKNEDFLSGLEGNVKWRKIYNGLLFNNVQSQLTKLIKLQLCQVSDGVKSFFNPFQKIPISMCYNKYTKSQLFEQDALYNLILLYDSRIKRDMNWNNLEETAKSTVRALNISEICKKNDRDCFEKEIRQRVLEKERFKGKELDFTKIYEAGIEDMTPISQINYS